jgi:hypothetical protein
LKALVICPALVAKAEIYRGGAKRDCRTLMRFECLSAASGARGSPVIKPELA